MVVCALVISDFERQREGRFLGVQQDWGVWLWLNLALELKKDDGRRRCGRDRGAH